MKEGKGIVVTGSSSSCKEERKGKRARKNFDMEEERTLGYVERHFSMEEQTKGREVKE